MSVTPEEARENEKRLRGVEEAVIEFKQIAKVVIVQHEARLVSLEKKDEEHQNAMHTSCDLKTKEIDTKVSDAKKDLVEFIKDVKEEARKYFVTSMSVCSAMFLCFIGAVVYFNGEDKAIIATNTAEHSKINEGNSQYLRGITENHTNIVTIIGTLEKMDSKLDKVIQHEVKGNK